MKHRNLLVAPGLILLACSLQAETGPLGTASSARAAFRIAGVRST